MVNEDFQKIYNGSKKRGEEQHPFEVKEYDDSLRAKMLGPDEGDEQLAAKKKKR